MTSINQEFEIARLPCHAGAVDRSPALPLARWLILLSLLLGCAITALADGNDSPGRSVPKATKYADFQSAFKSQMHGPMSLPQAAPPPANYQGLLVMAALAVGSVVILRRLIPRIAELLNRRYNPWVPVTAGGPDLSENVVVEEQTFTKFARAFRFGNAESEPATSASEEKPVKRAARAIPGPAERTDANPRRQALEEFFRSVPTDLATLRSIFSGIGRSSVQAERQKILAELCAQVGALKTRLGAFELLPAWQMALALDGLLHQLADKPSNMTLSAMRTAAGGLDLLQSLCVPGVRADLVKNPAIRFLAVDDDPISRRAVSLALQKAFQAPDVAEDGPTALALAARRTYDVVFLDVEMPGMDGYEVCTKIHETAANENTPVVFVTCHSDFEARAKSASSGGRDLIAKPFLSFEITVKALTLVLRTRLEQPKAGQLSAAKSPALAEAKIAPAAAQPPAEAVPAPISRARQQPAWHGPGQLNEMQAQLSSLMQSEEPGHRQKVLAEFCAGMDALTAEAERTGLKAANQLAAAIGKVAHKLLDKPAFFTPSAIQAAATALPLVEELGARGEQALNCAAVRVLVVDDDPIARRAISSAIQLSLGKPEIAESGEAALALAETKPFDVIFLDVMMPGMDGFATCSKIRETSLNSTTPVAFVTSRSDAESREKAVRFGGNGYITKPVLPTEIFLTALTFTLRTQMEKSALPMNVGA